MPGTGDGGRDKRGGKVRIKDVVEQSGVSAGAVSRILSGDPTLRVSEETRKRVVEAAKRLHYVPSHAAQSLRKSKAGTIALIIPEVVSAVVGELVTLVEKAAAEHDVNVMFARHTRLIADPTWLHRLLASGQVDGVLLQPPPGMTPEVVAELVDDTNRVVMINSYDSGPVSTVIFDDAKAIHVAVQHLHSLGHREIGFAGGLPELATSSRRLGGFTSALAELGLPCRPEHILDRGLLGEQGAAAARDLMAQPVLPTAIVVSNADAALGIVAEFRRAGISVPEDLSLMAMHDVWYADAISPPITTVSTQLGFVGARAVQLLLDESVDHPVHQVVTEPACLVRERASTAGPRHD